MNLYQRDTNYQKLDHFISIWVHSTFLKIANISKLKYSLSQKMLNQQFPYVVELRISAGYTLDKVK